MKGFNDEESKYSSVRIFHVVYFYNRGAVMGKCE